MSENSPKSEQSPRWFGFNRSKREELAKIDPNKEKEYPATIYTFEGDSAFYRDVTVAVYSAMVRNGFDILFIDRTKKGMPYRFELKSKAERKELKVQSALALGAIEATKRALSKLYEGEEEVEALAEARSQQAEKAAEALLENLLKNQDFYKEFEEYYGGLRWSQEKLITGMFEAGTELDFKMLEERLDIHQVETLVYSLELDIPYDERKTWRGQSIEAIFQKYPALDYHRLENEEFAQSAEGQKLWRAYQRLCGAMTARQQKGTGELIDTEGKVIPRPLIPLSRFPIVEALMIDEVSLDGPRPKYDMGPADVTDLIIASDSARAHHALTKSIIDRVPEEQRNVFDGPKEFQHKARIIGDVLRAYLFSHEGTTARDLLVQDIQAILEAYTGNGELVEVAKAEYAQRLKEGRRYSHQGQVENLDTIAKLLLTTLLTASEPQLTAKAEEMIATFMENLKTQELPPEVAIGKADLLAALIDSMDHVSVGSLPSVFSRATELILGDPLKVNAVTLWAELSIRAKEMRNQPKYLLAFGAWRSTHSYSESKTPAQEAAEVNYRREVAPIEEFEAEVTEMKNQFLLSFMRELVAEQAGKHSDSIEQLFKVLLGRLEISNSSMKTLSPTYSELMEIGRDENTTSTQRKDILWELNSQFEYTHKNVNPELVGLIFDMYELALGPVDKIEVTPDSSSGFAATRYLIRKHGKQLFEQMTPDQLQVFVDYQTAIRTRAEAIANNAFLPSTLEKGQNIDEWRKAQLQELGSISNDMQDIYEVYKEYLRIEEVKVSPEAFYAWMLEEFVPFWEGMNWEVGPGNNPTRDVKRLHAVLKSFVDDVIAIQKDLKVENNTYPKGFDPIELGGLEDLLRELYLRMETDHDIKYNTTVWQKGLPFLSNVIDHLPPSLFKEMTEGKNDEFAHYLKGRYAEFHKRDR